MKKVLYIILAAAVAAAACTKIKDDSSVALTKAAAPAVSIENWGEDGDSLKFSVTAAAGTGYFAYVICPEGEEVLSDDLISGQYVGEDGYVSEVIKASDKAAIVDYVGDLEYGAKYQIVAVAASPEGVLSEQATATCVLVDPYAPDFTDWETMSEGDQMAFAIVFDHELALQEGAYVNASFWGAYDPNVNAEDGSILAPQKVVKVDSLMVQENVLYVFIPEKEAVPGAFVSITLPAGIVKSTSKEAEPNEAYSNQIIIFEKGPERGIWEQYENTTFAVEAEVVSEPVMAADWESSKFALTTEVPYAFFNANKDASAIAKYVSVDASGRSVEKSSKMADENFIEDATEADKLYACFPVAPEAGEQVSFEIPAGFFIDIYGNTSDPCTLGPIGIIAEPLKAVFTATSIGANKVTYDVTVNDDGANYWIVDITEKSEAMGDAELVKAYVEAITKYAASDDVTFEEEMAEYFADKGNAIDLYAEINLSKKTEYQASVFFLSANGDLISDVFRYDFKTNDLVLPTTFTTGTYYYTGALTQLGLSVDPGLPFALDMSTGTMTISNWAAAKDLTIIFDEDGIGEIQVSDTGISAMVGERATLLGDTPYMSYFDTVENCVYLNTIYFAGSTLYSAGWEFFELDNSVAPTAAPARASMSSKTFKPMSISKRQKHVCVR